MKTQSVKINNTTTGTLNYPENVDIHTTDLPAILYLHGFGSNRDEVNGFYKDLASTFSSNNVVSLRIDFSGFGESISPMKEASISTMINDSLSALKYLKLLNSNFSKIGIIGFSLGAAIAILSTSNFQVDFLILISPALNFKEDFRVFLGESNFNVLAKCENTCKISLPWTDLELGKKFYNSLELYVPINSLKTFYNPLLCIVGSKDFTLSNANAINRFSTSSEKQLNIMNDVDHIFNDEHNISHLENVKSLISDWIDTSLLQKRKAFRI